MNVIWKIIRYILCQRLLFDYRLPTRKYEEMIGNHAQKGYYYDFLYNTFYPSCVITLFTGAEKKLG